MANEPICPPQSSAPLLKSPALKDPNPGERIPDIFCREWWLYLYNLGKNASPIDLPFITPEQYGATGAGVKDDTKSWQATIDAAVSTGKVIFASGTYLVSKQGSDVLPWDGLSHGWCLKSTQPITILGKPEFLHDISDSVVANIFLFQLVSGSRIHGLRATGLGAASSIKLYDGALLAFDRCTDCIITGTRTDGMRGNTLFFQGSDLQVAESFSSIPGTNFAGSHFASYGCNRATIQNCTAYAGCHDGDIVHFGTGTDDLATGNRTLNCSIYNYEYGDDTKTIVFNEAQGFLLDSGQEFGLVADCYAYGYFYGIDIKTTGEGNSANANTIEKCKVGIAARRGEGNAPTYNTYLNDNVIRPLGGNGNTEDLFDGMTDTVGYYLQDSPGVTIEGGTVEASYLFPGGGEQDYIPVFARRTTVPILDSVNDGLLISGVKFMNEMNVGGHYTYTRNVSIVLKGFSYQGTVNTSGTAVTRVSGPSFITGTSWNSGPIWIGDSLFFISSVTDGDHLTLTASAGVQTGVYSRVSNRFLRGGIVNCDFKMFSDFFSNPMLGIPIQISGCDQFTMDACDFSQLIGDYQLMTFTNIDHLRISKISSQGAAGYIDLNNCVDVSIDHCQFFKAGRNLSTALPVPIIYANVVSSLIVEGVRHTQGVSLDNGRLVQSSASGNGDLTIRSCQVQFTIFTVDWYAWNGTSLSSAANVSQSGNMVNSVAQTSSELLALTANRPVKTDANKNLTTSKIDPTAASDFDPTALTDLQPVIRNGSVLASAAGIDKTSSFTTGATTSTSTIQYLDWSSNQQSFTGVVSVSTNQETFISTKGIRTT